MGMVLPALHPILHTPVLLGPLFLHFVPIFHSVVFFRVVVFLPVFGVFVPIFFVFLPGFSLFLPRIMIFLPRIVVPSWKTVSISMLDLVILLFKHKAPQKH